MAVANIDVRVDSTGAVRSLNQINAASKTATTGINGLKSAIAPLLAAFSAIEAIKFTIVKTSELETQTRSLEVLTGSADKARQIIQQLQQLGAVTPFTSTELIDAAKRLQAFGVQANNVVDTTRRLADVAGATGAELQGLVTAYGQVQAKGRLQGEELLQFQERGIALQEELRKMYGLTGEEFQKALSKGRISAEAVEVAIVRLTEKGGKYANGAIAQSSTLAGKFSTLKDGIETLARSIGTTLAPAIKNILDLANEGVNAINTLMASGRSAAFGKNLLAAQTKLLAGAAGVDPALKDIQDLINKLQGSKQSNLQGAKADLQTIADIRKTLVSVRQREMTFGLTMAGREMIGRQFAQLRELEKSANEAVKRAKVTAKASAKTTPPPLLAEQDAGRQRSMDELIGGAIEQELARRQAAAATQKQLQLNYVATNKLGDAEKTNVDYQYELFDTLLEIAALQKTLNARAQEMPAYIAAQKDKEAARLQVLRQDDAIRNAINVKQEQLNAITAKYEGNIIAINDRQDEQAMKDAAAGQSKLQQLLDEQALLEARLKGTEAEVILKQQLRDLTKDMTPAQQAQATAASQAIEGLKRQLTVAEQMKAVYTDIGMSIKSGVVDAIQGAIDGTKTLGEVASSLLKSIANRILDVAVNFALFGAMSGTGTGGGLLGSLFKPRAMGGSVTAGQPYLVGERGPELFMPGRSGGIAPTGSFGGGPTVVVNVDASGTSVQGNQPEGQALGRAVAAAVQAELIKQKRPGGILA